MSSDLLAEFDTFYRAPQSNQSTAAPASNDLSFLNDISGKGNGQGHIGTSQQWQNPPPEPALESWGSMSSFQTNTETNIQRTAAPQGDIWGSFEVDASPGISQAQGRSTVTPPSYGASRPAGSIQTNTSSQKPEIIRRPTLDLFSSNYGTTNNSAPVKPIIKSDSFPPQRPPPVRESSYGDVLFDADEMSGEPEDDDDFGEFESVAPEPAPQMQPPPSSDLNSMFGAISMEPKVQKRPTNLLSTSSSMNGMLPYPQAPKSPSFQERNPFTDLGLSTKTVSNLKNEEKPKSASPFTAWPTFEPVVPKPNPYQDSPAVANEPDDDWGDFSDLPPETPVKPTAKATSGIEDDAWAWDAVDQVTAQPPIPKDESPPTNIPPPSVILALFPSIFDLPQTALFKPVANQPFSLKNRIISDPSTIEFLRAYLLVATVAAHIIAGRKLRWKRDTLLSQAMKIGQATAGGKSGMKLTGVDKAESTREDREAAEVVRMWKEQLGRLRSAIAIANSSLPNPSQHLAIPDVSEAMHVKTQERGLTAPKPCLICGLKREERVNKVDVDVEDSFGEWWVDHWGHRSCRNFWLEHEGKLKHR